MRHYGREVESILGDGKNTAGGVLLDEQLGNGFRFEFANDGDDKPGWCCCRLILGNGSIVGAGAGMTAPFAALAAIADAIKPGLDGVDREPHPRQWRPLPANERARLSAEVATRLGWWGIDGA